MNKTQLLNVVYGKMKKGQFKIQQMAFMLLAVFLFFVLVGLFWLAIQYRSLYKEASSLEEEKTSFVVEYLSSTSEFSCVNEEYCIDTDKIMILKEMKVYSEFWPGVAFIKVREIGGNNSEVECNKVNYPDCGIFNVYENKNIKSFSSPPGSFVALCRREKIKDYPIRVCELGKLIVGYEVK